MTLKKTIAIRIIKWTGAILAVVAALILLATWFINQEPFQKRIKDVVTRHAHGVVKFRDLSLALLPRPHVTIDKIAITVPGKLTGSVTSAVIYPRLLPLLAGKVSIGSLRLENPDLTVKLSEEPGAARAADRQTAFAETRAEVESAMTSIRDVAPAIVSEVRRGKITIQRDGRVFSKIDNISGNIALLPRGFDIRLSAEAPRWGRISLTGGLYVRRNSVAVKDLSVSGARSSLSGLTARFSWRKTPYLDIRSGQGVIVLDDVFERREMFGYLRDHLRNVKKVTGTIRFTEMNFIGPLLHEEQWKMQTAGRLEKIFVDSPTLPGRLHIGRGRFEATTKSLLLTGVQAAIMDSSLSGAAAFIGPFNRLRSLAASLEGKIGQNTVRWASKKFSMPQEFIVRAPLWLSGVHFTWEEGQTISLSGTAALNNGPTVSLDLRNSPAELLVKRLVIEDEKARALVTLMSSEKALEVAFNGRLSEDTLARIFERTSFDHGWIRGDFHAHVLYQNPRESTAQGALEGVNLPVPRKAGPPLTIKHIVLQANNKTITLYKGSFVWEDSPFEAQGRINAAREGFLIDMVLNVGSITLDSIERALASGKKEGPAGESSAEEKPSSRAKILGTIRFDAKDFTYGRYLLSPVKGNIFLDRNSVRIEIADTKLCGISLPGHFQPLGRNILLDLEPAAQGQQLEPVLECLSANHRISGTFNLTGKLHALAKGAELVRSLQGRVEFSARDGKIYRYPILARIFAFLNFTELLRGKLPDLGRDGFKYKSIKVKGDISNGKLVLDQAAVEGATLNIAAEGEIDFGSNKIDITVLVAPFKTIEYIISKIPLLRNILANKLVTIPIRVSGDLNSPDVTPLDPTAIGQNLLDIMKGILELPFRVIEPLFGRE